MPRLFFLCLTQSKRLNRFLLLFDWMSIIWARRKLMNECFKSVFQLMGCFDFVMFDDLTPCFLNRVFDAFWKSTFSTKKKYRKTKFQMTNLFCKDLNPTSFEWMIKNSKFQLKFSCQQILRIFTYLVLHVH